MEQSWLPLSQGVLRLQEPEAIQRMCDFSARYSRVGRITFDPEAQFFTIERAPSRDRGRADQLRYLGFRLGESVSSIIVAPCSAATQARIEKAVSTLHYYLEKSLRKKLGAGDWRMQGRSADPR